MSESERVNGPSASHSASQSFSHSVLQSFSYSHQPQSVSQSVRCCCHNKQQLTCKPVFMCAHPISCSHRSTSNSDTNNSVMRARPLETADPQMEMNATPPPTLQYYIPVFGIPWICSPQCTKIHRSPNSRYNLFHTPCIHILN